MELLGCEELLEAPRPRLNRDCCWDWPSAVLCPAAAAAYCCGVAVVCPDELPWCRWFVDDDWVVEFWLVENGLPWDGGV